MACFGNVAGVVIEARPYRLGEPVFSVGILMTRADLDTDHPSQGDMIVRDPDKPDEQWLVSASDLAAEFEEME